MRRKKLDVVFDCGVNSHADRMVEQLENIDDDTCSINKSEVLRCAMDIGLRSLQDKIDSKIEAGVSPKGIIKVSNLRALLKK